MKTITTLLIDIGGVCLSNGWDHISREKASIQFSLDYKEFEKRHKTVFKKLEKGKISLDEYLNRVIFFRNRKYSKEEFIKFIYSQSYAYTSTLSLLNKLSRNKKYYLATINNESLELNQYRINKFYLKKYFTNFFSSCFLGTRKPEPEIFFKALHILQKNPDECLFIDDREENYQSAKNQGLNAILLEERGELKERLMEYNVKI